MNKAQLMSSLRNSLRGLPEEELNKSLDFYEEAIADRIEDGMSEEDAVAAMGDVKEISDRILSEVSFGKLVKEKVKRTKEKRRGIRAWEIILLVLGFPVWFPLVLTAAILIFVFYLLFWILILTFYVVDLTFLLGGLGSIALAIPAFIQGSPYAGIVMIGGGLILTGLSIPLFMLCNLIAKGILKAGKGIVLGIKQLFVGKSEKEPAAEEVTKEAEVTESAGSDIPEAVEERIEEAEPADVPTGGEMA